MKALDYILNRVHYQFINLHWSIVWALVFYEAYKWPSTAAYLVAVLLAVWVTANWPKRWALDAAVIILVLLKILGWGLRASPWRNLVER